MNLNTASAAFCILTISFLGSAAAQEKCLIPSGGDPASFCERLQNSMAQEKSAECRLQFSKIMNQNECHAQGDSRAHAAPEASPVARSRDVVPTPAPRKTVETHVVRSTPAREQVRTVEIEIVAAPPRRAESPGQAAPHRMPQIIIVDHEAKPNGDVETKSKPVRTKREAQITVTPWMHD